MITKVINVNLHQPIYERLTAKQGDIASRYLLFHLLDGDKPFDLSNRTVRVYARKPDKTEIFNDLIINDRTKGYCTLELTSQCLASAGVVKMELYISESGKVLTSIPFELEVIPCINTANSVNSTNEFSALEVALGSLQDYDNLRNEIVQARKGCKTVGKRLDIFDSQLDTKANKNEIFTMANMGQDIKEAMAGGSVAVVGKNSILNENIVDGQVYGEKTNFLNHLNNNLFDGKFLNYYLSGDDNGIKLTKYETGKMFIIDVKPNTKYSINKTRVGKEESYYYFKVATFTKNAENVISLAESGDVRADGSVIFTATEHTEEMTNYIFTSGNNDKSVAVLVGKTKIPYIEICEGEYNHLQYDDYNGIYEIKDNVRMDGKLMKDKSIGAEKLSFLEECNKNLFDGKFLPFYISGSSSGFFKLVRSDLYKTLILDIEPDTTYTLLKDPTESEDGYYYTKIVSFISPKEQLVVIDDEYICDGSIGIGITNVDTTRLKFTTGPNDKSIAITVAKRQMPYVEVLKGDYSSFQDNSYEKKHYGKNLDYYRKSEVDEKLKSVATNTFIKNGEICDILLNGKVGYRLEHKITSGISLNTWMLTRGTVNENTLWSGSDIEAPIKEKGAADFIGGVHGDETFETVEILCDGVLLDLNQNYNLSFKNLTVFVKSTLNRCETNTPVFTRYKKLEFTSDELLISNRLVCLVDNFLVERHTGCGLYSVYKDLLIGYSVNTKPELIKDGGQDDNANMDVGTFYGEGFTITLKTISGKTNAYIGSVADFKTESRPRYKLYFDCIKSYDGYKIDANTELNTCFSIKIV